MAKKKNATFGGSKRGYGNGRAHQNLTDGHRGAGHDWGKSEQTEPRHAAVGCEYPTERFTNPVDAGLSAGTFGEKDEKTVWSDNPTTFEGGGAPMIRKGHYDELYEGK